MCVYVWVCVRGGMGTGGVPKQPMHQIGVTHPSFSITASFPTQKKTKPRRLNHHSVDCLHDGSICNFNQLDCNQNAYADKGRRRRSCECVGRKRRPRCLGPGQRCTGAAEWWAAQEGRLTPICMSLAWRHVFVSYCVQVCACVLARYCKGAHICLK